MKKLLSALLLLSGAVCLTAGFRNETFKTGSTQCFRVENDHYSIVVVPDYGGRIFQWKNKISGVYLTNSEIPDQPGRQDNLGGILDDRHFGNTPYSLFVFRPDPKTVTLYMKGFNQRMKLGIEKRLTFHADSPVINVLYKYSNHSHLPLVGFSLGQRSFFQVNGGTITTAETYFIPSTHTVRRISGLTLKGYGDELRGALKSALGGSWHALLSPPIRSGIAVHHNDRWYSGRYTWKAGIGFPTYEWLYGELAEGHSQTTTFDLIQVDGFDNLTYADRDLLTDLRLTPKKNKLEVKLKIKRLAPLPAGAKLSVTIRKEASKWKYTPKPVALAKDEITQVLPLKGDGAYAVEQRIMVGKQKIKSWYDTVIIGSDAELTPMFQPEYTENHDPELIPGWQAPPKVKLDFSKAAFDRKFAVSFPPADNHYRECTRLELDLIRGETESCELQLYPFEPSDKFTFSGRPPTGIGLKIIPETVFRHDSTGGSTTRFFRILIPRTDLDTEKPASVWLIVDTAQAKPGKYTFPVEFRNQAGKTATVAVTVHVSPVALPRRKPVMLESEVNFPKNVLDNPALLNAWMRNLNGHNVDFLQVGSATGFTAAIPGNGVRDEELGLLNYVTDTALTNGLTRVKTARYSKQPPSKEEYENWKRLGLVLRQKGFQNKDIFVKILDEQPPDQFPAMAAMGKWLKEVGFRPFSTFAALFSFPERLKILSPSFDLYQGGTCGPETVAARRKDGLLKPGDLIGTYTGYGNSWQTYVTMLNWGIQAAFLRHDFFHNHEYMRGGNYRLTHNIVRIGEDSIPQDSPAHEGLRDGMDFANLAGLCRDWLARLENHPQYTRQVREFRKEYDRIFGGILKKVPVTFTGVSDYKMQPASMADYLQAKAALLKLAEKIRKATEGKDFARVTWNEYALCEPAVIFQAEGPEADYFTAAFRKAFRIPEGKREPGVKIVFRIAPTGKLSYRIMPEKDRIVVEAPNAEGLRKAADNWINTMDPSGIWF
ncbi:MAG: hypothetical protein J5806_10035 [Lentisphaeria bacterium]|nr:hypothetical protein [Lentisphaeria bacterium]